MDATTTTALPPAAGELVERHLGWLRVLAGRHLARHPGRTADDVAQEFALAALRRFASYDPARGSFSTWLAWVAKSCTPRRREQVGLLEDAGWVGDPRQLEPWALAALREEHTPEPDGDLPPALRDRSATVRGVYRVIREVPLLTATGVIAECKRRAMPATSKATVCHALTKLRRLGLTRKDRDHRWQVVGKWRDRRS